MGSEAVFGNAVVTGSDAVVSTNSLLKRSRFLHRLKKGDVVCLFHGLTQNKVFGGPFLSELYEFLESPRTMSEIRTAFSAHPLQTSFETAYVDLAKKKMLVTDNEDDVLIYRRFLYHGLIERPIQHMYFLPTNACNLRCRYCFIEDNDKPFSVSNMTEETSRKALEVFAKLTQKAEKISIAFYGGEPLSNRKVTYAALRYVRQLEKDGAFSKEVELSLLTNGLLVDESTVDVVRETRTFVAVSWDGQKEFHDSVRPDVQGNPTSERALHAYHILKDAGLSPGISCTIHRYNIDHIVEIARYIAEELNPAGMGFNLLLPLIGSGNPMDVSHEYAVMQLIEAFKILREHGIYEDRIMRRVKPFVEKGFYFKDFMGVGGQIVIIPDGAIGPCQAFVGVDGFFPMKVDELHARLPNIDSSTIYADPLFAEWNTRMPLHMKACIDCFAIAVCGGGCPYASYANNKSIWEIDERICHQAKRVLEWMLWETYDRMLNDMEAPSRMTLHSGILPSGRSIRPIQGYVGNPLAHEENLSKNGL
jgi:uncharacterized protein